MATFSFKAVRHDGKRISGSQEALNVYDLESKLEKNGTVLITAKERTAPIFTKRKKITRRDIIDFYIYMEQMFQAGIPVIESRVDFRDVLEPTQFKQVVSSLIDQIESGKKLSESMFEHHQVFSNLMVELVRVGERTGELATIFGEIKKSLMWQDELIVKTKKLMMYPLFVGTVVFGVLCFMMIYLVPQMVGFITEMGGELPFHTLVLIGVSEFFVEYWYLILMMPILIVLITKILINKNNEARLIFDRNILLIPWLGPILKKIILARFATNFALMYRSGIGVLEALKVTEGVVDNIFVAGEIDFIHSQVTEGAGLSDAFSRTDLFPPLVMRMIRVGEQTGGIDKSLVNVSYFFDRDVEDSIEKLQSMIEPAMTVILGVILGWVMMSVLGPIYDLIGGLEI
jgi:type IV pilus assembly protein PilC